MSEWRGLVEESMFGFNEVVKCVKKCKPFDNLTEIENCFSNSDGSDSEKKTALDQSFRDVLHGLIKENSDCTVYKGLINQVVLCVKQEFCNASTPFLILSDIFDSVTLDKCEAVFTYVEEGVAEWKSETFYTAGKNYLLRMCNDLLRRLSKSQNTVFCGRIQLFLARLFPLSEKSGLNLMSQFNLDNITKFDLKDDEQFFKPEDADKSKEEGMEIEEGEMEEQPPNSVPIDYNMYRKFWSLQDYFRTPVQCYDKLAWRKFTSNASDVLSAFASYKLDDIRSSKKKLEHLRQTRSETYFAKYLTSSKLLDLQLSDSNFRRYVLVQFLILFQYLNAAVKFKSADHVLNDEQANWVKETQAKIMQLIKETPPDGDKFAKYIEHVLNREEHWNSWKNDGCPSYVREMPQEENKPKVFRRKRSMGDDIKASGGKIIKMGNSELTRLWNLCPDNLEACKADKRVFQPSLEGFFEDVIEQTNPANQIDNEYKDYLKPNWQWVALRLLSKRSPHFFSPTNQPGKTLVQYLENLLGQMAKEMPSATEDQKVDEEEGIKEDQGQDEELQEEPVRDENTDLLSSEQIQALAGELAEDWRRLAVELNFSEEDIGAFENEEEEEKARAEQMLLSWQVSAGDAATSTSLHQSLKEIGLSAIGNSVFGADKDS
ncbi:THO complex subunit 1-like isoform X2 [Lineus longissimus]|uniref:THO complex subunit 1-like isoform X2 n=1 Tax=Lineus longissimus TaxID=88925 RepID=UPI00315CAD35